MPKAVRRRGTWCLLVLLSGLGRPARAQNSDAAPGETIRWRRLVRNVAEDQKGIWLSPFRASRRDAKWWLLFGSATGVLIATDKWTAKQLPNTDDQIRVSSNVSRLGATYTLGPALMTIYLAGAIRKDDRLRKTGLLGVEALADSLLVTGIIKVATQRERPLEGNGSGQFWQGDGRIWNKGASFPSGHSTQTWAVATVIAHAYPRPRIVPVAAYGLAGAVTVSRFTARRHFASDVIAGAAVGWFVGNYVIHKRLGKPAGSPRSKLRAVLSALSPGP